MERMTKKEIRLEVENALQEYDCFHIYNFKIIHIENNPSVDFQDYSVIAIADNKCLYVIWKDNFDSTINIHLLTLSDRCVTEIISG